MEILKKHLKEEHPIKPIDDKQKLIDEFMKMNSKFPLTPMGVLAPGSAHARPSAQPPIDVSGNFPAHVSAESPSYLPPNYTADTCAEKFLLTLMGG